MLSILRNSLFAKCSGTFKSKPLAAAVTMTNGISSSSTGSALCQYNNENATEIIAVPLPSPTSTITRSFGSVWSSPEPFSSSSGNLFKKSVFTTGLNNQLGGGGGVIYNYNQVRGMKWHGKVKRRCKDCYLMYINGVLYNLCKSKPRHKHGLKQAYFANQRILTHATMSNKRPW